MNKVFNIFIIAALFSLLSCNREVIPQQDATPIQFGQVETRAGLPEVQANGFSVWASVSSKDAANTVQYEPLLENEKVYFKNGEWTYENTEYWIPNSHFYFLATYPNNILLSLDRVENQGKLYSIYSTEVTANGKDTPEDILVATNVTDTSIEGYDETVKLQFFHLLSKVNVKIRQNFDIDPDFNYYVTKITITGVKGNGVYQVMPYVNTFISNWDFNNATNIILEKDFSANPVLLRDEGAADPKVTLTVWDDGLMLIPQEFPGGNIAVRVDYLYDVNLDDDDKGEPKFVEGFIPAGEWESGKSVNYTLAIANSSFITFEQPRIDPWGAPQTGGTIIIQ